MMSIDGMTKTVAAPPHQHLAPDELVVGEKDAVAPTVLSNSVISATSATSPLSDPSTTSTQAATRLATYGTLAPGKPNHHHLSQLKGSWTDGYARGHLRQSGWGAAMGFPGLIVDEKGPRFPLQVFESADLPAHWARIDAFEGDGYRRVPIAVETDKGVVVASIYALADGHAPGSEQ